MCKLWTRRNHENIALIVTHLLWFHINIMLYLTTCLFKTGPKYYRKCHFFPASQNLLHISHPPLKLTGRFMRGLVAAFQTVLIHTFSRVRWTALNILTRQRTPSPGSVRHWVSYWMRLQVSIRKFDCLTEIKSYKTKDELCYDNSPALFILICIWNFLKPLCEQPRQSPWGHEPVALIFPFIRNLAFKSRVPSLKFIVYIFSSVQYVFLPNDAF